MPITLEPAAETSLAALTLSQRRRTARYLQGILTGVIPPLAQKLHYADCWRCKVPGGGPRLIFTRLDDALIVHEIQSAGQADKPQTPPQPPRKRRFDPAMTELRRRAIELLQKHYADQQLTPTEASRKLLEQHGLDVYSKTLSRWMQLAGFRWRRRQPRLLRQTVNGVPIIDAEKQILLQARAVANRARARMVLRRTRMLPLIDAGEIGVAEAAAKLQITEQALRRFLLRRKLQAARSGREAAAPR